MTRVTGVGGIFFRCDDPKALLDWYRRVLGFVVEDWGGVLFRPADRSAPHMVWSPFPRDTDYFRPGDGACMINFTVDDLDGVVERLKSHGVAILGREDNDPTGRFAWFLDPADMKVELWEPKVGDDRG